MEGDFIRMPPRLDAWVTFESFGGNSARELLLLLTVVVVGGRRRWWDLVGVSGTGCLGGCG